VTADEDIARVAGQLADLTRIVTEMHDFANVTEMV
jgi:hypothetical protein